MFLSSARYWGTTTWAGLGFIANKTKYTTTTLGTALDTKYQLYFANNEQFFVYVKWNN